MSQHDEVERGRQAAELLEHPLMVEALKAIEDEIFKQWGDCPARDKDGKEACWQLLKTAQKFRAILTGYVSAGKLAKENLRRLDEAKGLRGLLHSVRR